MAWCTLCGKDTPRGVDECDPCRAWWADTFREAEAMRTPATVHTSAEKVFLLYCNNPDAGKGSYLYAHYLRGVEGIMEPDKGADLAHAAWRAGRNKTRMDRRSAGTTKSMATKAAKRAAEKQR